MNELQRELDELDRQGLRRFWRCVEAVDGGRILIDGQWRVHLASNNYLGLSTHPRVVAAAREALEQYGAGAGSARLIGGTFPPHEQLEEELARFKQAEAAIVFPTGYMANLGIITTLAGPDDLLIGDRLNHASLIDACRLSRATFRVYPHLDAEKLNDLLKQRRAKYRRVLIIAEGLFSMDGDCSPLKAISELARRYDAWLMVDDAHGTGVLGEAGRGSLEAAGVSPEGIFQMGTLSKAIGSVGGYLAGPKAAVELIKNKARSFIFTTALPPASAAAAHEALRVIQQEPVWRENLWNNVRHWTEGLKRIGLPLVSENSPIVPIQVGDNRLTMEIAQSLFDQGVYAPGIRPPTVPEGQARIRTSVTALHTTADLDNALKVFEKTAEVIQK